MIDISKKIKMACSYADISMSELARRLGTSAQAFNQRLSTGRFSSADLQKIADALGADIEFNIVFKDGNKI